MKAKTLRRILITSIFLLTTTMLTACDLFTTPQPTQTQSVTQTQTHPQTTVSSSTTNKETTNYIEPKEEYQIIYIVDNDTYKKEFYYVEDEVALIEYEGTGLFSGWFKDYTFTDGPYSSHLSYDTDPVYFYGFTMNGNAEDAIALIEQIPDTVSIGRDEEIVSNASKYFQTLPEEEVANVTNKEKLENAEKAILYQQAIYNTAYAYYYQGTEIDYDQYNQRRNMYAAPEDATSARELFLDCSSYVNSIYYNCFGVDIIPIEVSRIDTAQTDSYSSTYIGKSSDVLYYVENRDYTTKESQQALLNEIKSNLIPGDVINYRHGSTSGSSGHMLIYVGGDVILHCTGSSIYIQSSTNPDSFYEKTTSNEEAFGAIGKLSIADVFTSTTSDRYLFKKTSSDSVYSFSILRPLERDNLSISDSALSRTQYGILNIEKTSSVPEFTGVRRGDEITYTISIQNKSGKEVKNLNIYEEIPSGTSFVASENPYVFEDGKYVFKSDIAKGKTIKISYTIKIGDLENGSIVMDDGTFVDLVPTNKIFHIVEEEMDYDLLEESIRSTMGNSYVSELAWMRDALGVNILPDMDSAKELLASLYTSSNYLKEDSPVKPYVVKDLWGGFSVAAKYALDNNRVRAVMSHFLECGDMIFTKTGYNQGSSYKYSGYIFISNSMILKLEGQKVVVGYSGEKAVQSFLTSLYAYNQFAILRSTIK